MVPEIVIADPPDERVWPPNTIAGADVGIVNVDVRPSATTMASEPLAVYVVPDTVRAAPEAVNV